jgi:hypothetical protein
MNNTNTKNTIYNGKTISSQCEQETRKIAASSINPSVIQDILSNDDFDRIKKKGYTLEHNEGIHQTTMKKETQAPKRISRH